MDGAWFCCFLVFIALLKGSAHGTNTGPVVKTNYGELRGIRANYKGEIFDEFRGIRYALPPVGALRWQRPQRPASWSGVRDATEYGLPCTQLGLPAPGSGEDCLYLNLYVPNGVFNTTKKPLPVMVWVHGGGLIAGNSNFYHSQELALTGQVIVAMFNYRLSALGGLSTSDANSPGNYHLWDARAALLWVRDNIGNFGGDKSRVTLFGQSSGGTVVSHLAVSPLTKGLIHRVICMSGASSSAIGIQHQSRQMAQDLGEVEECPQTPNEELVRCLKGKEAAALDQSGYLSMVALGGRLPGWLPVVDGEMVSDFPKNAWYKGDAKDIDYMIGRMEHEAASFVFTTAYGGRGEGTNLAADRDLLDLIVRFLLQTYAPGDVQDLMDVILAKYPDLTSDDTTRRTQAAVRIASDWVFTGPAHLEAEAHSMTSPSKNTFLYNFHYRPSFVHYEPWVRGSHNDEMHFVFGEPFRPEYRRQSLGNYSEEDLQLKQHMMHYFANFAYTGDPGKGPHPTPTAWPQYEPQKKQYLEFAPKIEVKKEDADLLGRINFWLNEWPKLTVPEETVAAEGKVLERKIPRELLEAIYLQLQSDNF